MGTRELGWLNARCTDRDPATAPRSQTSHDRSLELRPARVGLAEHRHSFRACGEQGTDLGVAHRAARRAQERLPVGALPSIGDDNHSMRANQVTTQCPGSLSGAVRVGTSQQTLDETRVAVATLYRAQSSKVPKLCELSTIFACSRAACRCPRQFDMDRSGR
jgi:hypothetical protein